MAETAQYGYGFAEDVDRIAADDLAALQADLEEQIAAVAGGGDPQVIIDMQEALAAMQIDVDTATSTATAASSAVAAKASTGYVDSAVAAKADTSYVDAEVATRASAASMTTALAAKADASAVTTALAAKANTSDLNAKADVSAMNTALALKADASTVTTALAAKADAAATTTALGLKADASALTSGLAGKLNLIANTVNVDPQSLQMKIVRVGDATDDSTWKNLFELWWTPNGGASKLVGWYNEFGEWRGLPGKTNTVPWRLFVKDLVADAAHTGNMMEVTDHREGTRTALFSVGSDGSIVTMANLTVGGNATVAGTLAVTGRVTGVNLMDYKGAFSSPPSTTGWAAGAFWYDTTNETIRP